MDEASSPSCKIDVTAAWVSVSETIGGMELCGAMTAFGSGRGEATQRVTSRVISGGEGYKGPKGIVGIPHQEAVLKRPRPKLN